MVSYMMHQTDGANHLQWKQSLLGGAIYNGDGSERGITTFPDNTVFDSNVAEVRK